MWFDVVTPTLTAMTVRNTRSSPIKTPPRRVCMCGFCSVGITIYYYSNDLFENKRAKKKKKRLPKTRRYNNYITYANIQCTSSVRFCNLSSVHRSVVRLLNNSNKNLTMLLAKYRIIIKSSAHKNNCDTIWKN